MPSIFKRAMVNGIATELVRAGYAAFPSKEAMDATADAVADSPEMAAMPEESGPQGPHPDDVATIGNKLIEIGQALIAEGGGGAGGPPPGMPPGAPMGAGGPPPGMPPEMAAGMAEAKQASARDYETLAFEAADRLITKTAAEVKMANPQGALIHGGDKQNTPSAAAGVDSVAALDEKQRPQGTYQVPVGDTSLDTSAGTIGHLAKHDKAPANSPSGSNSLTQDTGKTAALTARIQQMLKEGNALIGQGGDHKNTAAAAAKTDTVASLDAKQRPRGYAVVGQGNTNIKEDAAARIGKETPHPHAPKNGGGGSNSVIEASKSAGLTEDEQAYKALFDKTAADVGQYLPPTYTVSQKIAAISQMIPMDRDQRQEGLNQLYKQAGPLHEIVKSMGMGEEETKAPPKAEKSPEKDDKPAKEEKGEKEDKDGKKESALMASIREIASASARPTA